jgi:hypothetical protein
MPYLIQGFFFQEDEGLGIEMGRAVVYTGLFRHMYSGIIYPVKPKSEKLAGEMKDTYGYSELSMIKISEQELHFRKKYVERTDEIYYTFKREGSIWVGEYRGLAVGNGSSKCSLVEVPESLFHPPN